MLTDQSQMGKYSWVVKREKLKGAQHPDDSGKTEKAKRIPESEGEGREKNEWNPQNPSLGDLGE